MNCGNDLSDLSVICRRCENLWKHGEGFGAGPGRLVCRTRCNCEAARRSYCRSLGSLRVLNLCASDLYIYIWVFEDGPTHGRITFNFLEKRTDSVQPGRDSTLGKKKSKWWTVEPTFFVERTERPDRTGKNIKYSIRTRLQSRCGDKICTWSLS